MRSVHLLRSVCHSISVVLISGTFVVGSANAEPLQDANISVSASEDVSAGISRDHIAELDDVGLESETEVGIVASSKVTDTKLKLSAAATGIVNLSEDIEARKIRLKNLAKYKLGGGWDAVLSYEPTWSLALDSNESTLRRDKFKIAFKYKKTWLSAGTCMGGSENDPCSELNVDLGYSEFVYLCEGHASEEFRRQRHGRDFVHSISRACQAAGHLTPRRIRALRRLSRLLGTPQPPPASGRARCSSVVFRKAGANSAPTRVRFRRFRIDGAPSGGSQTHLPL